jgi:hypothetical protein
MLGGSISEAAGAAKGKKRLEREHNCEDVEN